MKLNVLSVSDSRARPMCHCQSVAARTPRVGCVAVDAPQSACSQYCHVCQIAVHSLSLAIEQIAAMTSNGPVIVQLITRVVWKGDQIYRGCLGFDRDIGTALERAK